MPRIWISCLLAALVCLSPLSTAGGTSAIDQQIDKAKAGDAQDQQQQAAALLADYEAEARRLIATLPGLGRTRIDRHAHTLMRLAEAIMGWARRHSPPCDAYLQETLRLTALIDDIDIETLERDYHHDGALPPAPPACYHIKDLLVHPASVLVLTRLDPTLRLATRKGIAAEINEVLRHIEAVRQLLIYQDAP